MTTSGYDLVDIPVPSQRLIHVYPDASELGRVYRPDLAVVARPAVAIQQLAARAADGRGARSGLIAAARADYDAWQVPEATPGALRMEHVIGTLREMLPDDAIVTNGAGNYAGWLHRYYRYHAWRTQLAPTSGSMGYGLPAAIAAKRAHPERDVICLAGDGCFQMVSQEFGTAVQHGVDVIVLVCDNGMYGTIRMHQQMRYPKRPSGTDLVNPDFARLAEAHGGHGVRIERNADFRQALTGARAAGKPAILHLVLSPEALSPRVRLETMD
jgi:acetolactate synthase-1/2/3 large subunit